MKSQVQEFTQLWNRILTEIKTQLNDDRIYNTFFSDTEINNIDNNTLYVVVNSRLAKQVLSTDYYSLISKVVENILESNY
ncbi:MAG: hypothetical protein MJ208_03470, partial [Bacilli bacterium]|nr:hypothetical protein [Bacilli bacterium]